MTKTQLIVRLLLTIHLTGLVLMAGTTVMDFLAFKTVCKLSDHGDSGSVSLVPLMSRYGLFIRIGAGILILTGIAMLTLSKGIWQERWLQIKLALVLVLVLHGMLVGNPQAQKFRSLIPQNHMIPALRANLDRFYLIQLTLFFLIVVASAVKFK